MNTQSRLLAALAEVCPRVHTELTTTDYYMVTLSYDEAKLITQELVKKDFVLRKVYTSSRNIPGFEFAYGAAMWQIDSGISHGLLFDFVDTFDFLDTADDDTIVDDAVLTGGIALISAKTAEIQL